MSPSGNFISQNDFRAQVSAWPVQARKSFCEIKFPLGLVMAWVLIDVINRRAFGWQMDITVSPKILLSSLALSIGAALVAGLYPAWRVANAPIAAAMREE